MYGRDRSLSSGWNSIRNRRGGSSEGGISELGAGGVILDDVGFRVRAVNTAADSENKIHNDAVAASYGFRGGLVPGVTVYGYLAAAVVEHFGDKWLERGAMDVRFERPVYEGQHLEITIEPEESGHVRVRAGDYASGIAWIGGGHPTQVEHGGAIQRKKPSAETLAAGKVLGTYRERLDLKASKMSAPLEAAMDGKAHPAVLLALANRVFVENYELGPWIHVASEVRKFRPARDGEEIEVRAKVLEQYERKGHQFAVLDVLIGGATPIEQVRHTAIWEPRVSR